MLTDGIGTSTPANKFVVAEGTNQHGIELVPGTLSYIQAYDRATSDYGDLKIDAQTIAFGTDNGAERMRIDSAGNVGIGVTPNASHSKLQVKSPASSYGFDLIGRDAGANSESQITFWNSAQTSTLAAIFNIADEMAFATGTTSTGVECALTALEMWESMTQIQIQQV